MLNFIMMSRLHKSAKYLPFYPGPVSTKKLLNEVFDDISPNKGIDSTQPNSISKLNRSESLDNVWSAQKPKSSKYGSKSSDNLQKLKKTSTLKKLKDYLNFYPSIRSNLAKLANKIFSGVLYSTTTFRTKNSDLDPSGPSAQVQSSLEPKEPRPSALKDKDSIYEDHLFQTFEALKFVKTLPKADLKLLKEKTVRLAKKPGYEDKKTIIFDLDETLVHCVNDINTKCDVTLKINFPTGGAIDTRINVRPYANECLKESGKYFEVIVFTASQKCYADAVLDYLDPNNELVHHRLYRENCVSVNGVFVKDLRVIADRRLQDIVIVDNSAYSFGYQLDNGIPIISWTDDPYDRELYNLIDYIKILADSNDIRVTNNNVFHLNTFYDDYIEEFFQGDRKKAYGC
jgi:Dullard-like phosphatase family protein